MCHLANMEICRLVQYHRFCTASAHLRVAGSKWEGTLIRAPIFHAWNVQVVLQVDALGESTYGSMRVLHKLRMDGVVPLLGLRNLDDILEKPVDDVRATVHVCP
jgi:hypothetical protein